MNKIILLIILFLPAVAPAQKYVFLNNDIKRPAFTVDTAGIKIMNEGYIGFYREDIDSVVSYLKLVRDLIGQARSKNRYIQYKTGHAIFLGERFHYYYGARYDVNLYPLTGELAGKIIVSNSRFSNKVNLKRIDQLINYISSAKK